VWAQVVSGQLELDVEPLVAKDLLGLADDGIGELRMEVVSRGELVVGAGLDDGDVDGFVRVD
jgi:hypothetical protein